MKKKIALFTTGWSVEILTQFVSDMQNELSSDNADIYLFLCYAAYTDSPARRQGELNMFNLPDMKDFDGAVIFGSGLDYADRIDNIISRCKEAGVPVVMQGARRDGVSYVGADNYQAVKDLCAHLINEHGAKDIVFFAGSKESYDSELRLKGVRDYLKEHGSESYLREVFYTNWENATAEGLVNELCRSGSKLPDAFICANDGLAISSCIALNNNGYEVPKDVLITGFDYIDGGKIFYPSIATVDQCFDAIGASAIKTLRKLANGEGHVLTDIVPCRFMPGDSCNCSEFRNSDELRRTACRGAYISRSESIYFNRKLKRIDSTILACSSYHELKDSLTQLLEADHDFEGDSFHILMEPNFGLSTYDTGIKLNTDKYSKTMEVIYSSENGIQFGEATFDSRDLIPGNGNDDVNHLYIFLPLHDEDSAFGYIVFRDCLEKFDHHFIQNYYERFSLALEKFRYAATIDHMNKQLIDIMNRDSLTSVNNRMAYENKERQLQAEIKSGTASSFAIAMFDVNSLKLINDSGGHETGDEYLLRCCRFICQVFKHSPVYRVGGDEFVAVLRGEDYINRDELVKQLNETMSPYSNTLPLPEDYVSVACGIAEYSPENDKLVSDVVKRADDAMYKDKEQKKRTAK